MIQKTAVIIVTHNAQKVLDTCIDALTRQQDPPHQVIIVDSGSDDRTYLEKYLERDGFSIHLKGNIGFSASNNVGMGFVDSSVNFILIMNPDTFLPEDCLSTATAALADQPKTAILTGMLKGYDIDKLNPSGLIDSTGIFRNWYGRWHDRGQGEEDRGQYDEEEEIPAVCGAFMLCKKEALESVTENGSAVFDEAFFLYKEDIDLSLRLRKKGWRLKYDPRITAYHARGWAASRKSISYETRCMASANEIRLNLKHRSPYLLWSLGKYLAVRFLNI